MTPQNAKAFTITNIALSEAIYMMKKQASVRHKVFPENSKSEFPFSQSHQTEIQLYIIKKIDYKFPSYLIQQPTLKSIHFNNLVPLLIRFR